MRLTEKYECGYEIKTELHNFGGKDLQVPICKDQDVRNKLGQLEDIEEELGIDLITFLKECIYVLKHSNMSTSYTSKGTKITTDFGYVEQFINEIKNAIKEELLNESNTNQHST